MTEKPQGKPTPRRFRTAAAFVAAIAAVDVLGHSKHRAARAQLHFNKNDQRADRQKRKKRKQVQKSRRRNRRK